MAQVSDPGTLNETKVVVASTIDAQDSASGSKWYRWRKDGKALVTYLLDSEVHT